MFFSSQCPTVCLLSHQHKPEQQRTRSTSPSVCFALTLTVFTSICVIFEPFKTSFQSFQDPVRYARLQDCTGSSQSSPTCHFTRNCSCMQCSTREKPQQTDFSLFYNALWHSQVFFQDSKASDSPFQEEKVLSKSQ